MKKFDLVHTTILIVAILSGYAALQYLPFAVTNLFELFSNKVSGHETAQGSGQVLAIELLRITIGASLVYAAPGLTNFIEKNIAARLDGGS
jgi:hypothetical protein